jgi:hypothetical protein
MIQLTKPIGWALIAACIIGGGAIGWYLEIGGSKMMGAGIGLGIGVVLSAGIYMWAQQQNINLLDF